MHQVTRRGALRYSGTLLALPFAAMLAEKAPFVTGSMDLASTTRAVSPISEPLLNYVNNGLAQIWSRMLQGKGQPPDIEASIRLIKMLGQHFASAGVDALFMEAASSADWSAFYPSNPPEMESTLQFLRGYDPSVTLNDLFVSEFPSQDELTAIVADFKKGGLSPFYLDSADALRHGCRTQNLACNSPFAGAVALYIEATPSSKGQLSIAQITTAMLSWFNRRGQ